MKKKKVLSILSVATIALAGCGESHIEKVKGSYTGFDETLSLEQILDHRKLCREVEWTEFEDDKGRSVVEYKCSLNGTASYFENLMSSHIKTAESRYEEGIVNAKREYDTQYKNIEYYLKEVEKYKLEKVALEKDLNEIKAIDSEMDDLWSKHGLDEADGVSKKDWDKYKSELKQLDKKYPDIELSKIHFYLERQENLLEGNDDKLRSAMQRIPDEIDIEDRYTQSLDYAKQLKNEMIGRAQGMYDISDVYERYQWSFDKDNNPVYIYSGYEIVKSTGKEISQQVDFDTMFDYAYKNQVETIDNYFPVKFILANKLGLSD